jgi:hypothetical protein
MEPVREYTVREAAPLTSGARISAGNDALTGVTNLADKSVIFIENRRIAGIGS